MQYILLQYDNGQQLLQETFSNVVQRYCDLDGNTTNPPPYGSQVLNTNYTPSFPPTPDPYVEPSAPAQVKSPTTWPIVGVPVKTFTHDDKGQLVRIDYPDSPNGRYTLIEYIGGRVSKVSAFTSAGLELEHYHYYDDFGRPLQIDRP